MGLLLLGIIDSSFLLFLPLGNDILLVGLTAGHPTRWFYYVLMSSAGSVIGCLFTYWASLKGGEEGLKKHASKSRLAYVQAQVKKRGALALAVSSVMPPPFPFTVFVVVAGALKYPWIRLLAVVGACRLLRFSAEALLAEKYGTRILGVANTPLVQWTVLALVALSIGGTAYSLYNWSVRSKR